MINRGAWLEQIARDLSVSPEAVRLAIILASHVNRKTGEAWPGQQTLANAVGRDVRQVQRLLNELRDRRYVSERRVGNGQNNRYSTTLPDTTNMSHQDQGRGDKNVGSENEQTRHFCRVHKDEPSSEPSEGDSPSSPSLRNTTSDALASFLSVYPKSGRTAATRRAWAAAIKKASPDEIVGGARAYRNRVRREGIGPRYIKQPDNWLRDEAWQDAIEPEILPEPAVGIANGQSKQGGGTVNFIELAGQRIAEHFAESGEDER